jgi:RecA-family ATPase
MYVDEEQAPDLVLQRLSALGLKPEHRHNVDYLNFAGVDLYSESWKLLDEVIDSRPLAIFIDSQSAVSIGAEENSNDDMTKLFRDAIRPLARETGAAVFILHHTTKDNKGAPRGASAIRNQADQVLSIVEAESDNVTTGRLNIFASKPRRNTKMVQAVLDGDMERDGYVNVIAAMDLECA